MECPLQSKRVVVAMSGGVDSAVAALLLREAGYDVIGVFFCLRTSCDQTYGRKACCSPEDATDARRIAAKLGIEFHVIDVSKDFEPIITSFIDEYRNARTPNPCIHCNRSVKFAKLIEFADSLGVTQVATGHYARVIDYSGQKVIARAVAREKDQSYVLVGLSADMVPRLLFPLGEIANKSEVRAKARTMGLEVHDKPDSQEICFTPNGDWKQLLKAQDAEDSGAGVIQDSSGKILGRHDGYAYFTIGQRRGLGVAGGIPLYVTHIDAQSHTVTLGPRSELESRGLAAAGANWFINVEKVFEASVKIRYAHTPVPATIVIKNDDSFEVHFAAPVSAVTPGQAAVVYNGDIMLGGGWIESALQT
jgi:tRNA-uridine 2-sulfurtransferase